MIAQGSRQHHDQAQAGLNGYVYVPPLGAQSSHNGLTPADKNSFSIIDDKMNASSKRSDQDGGQSDSEAETVIIETGNEKSGHVDDNSSSNRTSGPSATEPSVIGDRTNGPLHSENGAMHSPTRSITDQAVKVSRIRSPDPIIGKRKRNGNRPSPSDSSHDAKRLTTERTATVAQVPVLNGDSTGLPDPPTGSPTIAPAEEHCMNRESVIDSAGDQSEKKGKTPVTSPKAADLLDRNNHFESVVAQSNPYIDEAAHSVPSKPVQHMEDVERKVSPSFDPSGTNETSVARAGSEPTYTAKDGSLSARRRRNSKRQTAAPILPPSSRRLHHNIGDISDLHHENRFGIPHSSSTPDEGSLMSPLKMPKKLIDATGRTYLARACASDKQEIEKVRDCYEEHPEHLNTADYAGTRPLHEASLQGFTGAVEFLIDKNCDIDVQNEDGDTALIDAAANGHLQTVIALLKGGANPTNRNRKGEDALDAIIVNDDDEEEDKRNVESIKDAINKAKTKRARDRRASEGERRPRFDIDDDTTTSREQSVSSRHHSPPVTGRSGPLSPPLRNLHIRRGKRRGEAVGNSALYFDAQKCTLKELVKATELGDKHRVLQILDNKPSLASLEPLLIATKGGDEMLINLLVLNMTDDEEIDPNPSQTDRFKKGQHTPILAAIGRGKPQIVRLLLETKRIDPSRTFEGKTYSDIARERQSEGWEEEFDLLEQHRAEKLGVSPKKRPNESSAREYTPSPKKEKSSTVQLKYGRENMLSNDTEDGAKMNGSTGNHHQRKVIGSSPESDVATKRKLKSRFESKHRAGGHQDLKSDQRRHRSSSPAIKRQKSEKSGAVTHEAKKLKLTLSANSDSASNRRSKSTPEGKKESKIKLIPSSISKQQKDARATRSSPARATGRPAVALKGNPVEAANTEAMQMSSSPSVKKELSPSDNSTPLTSPRDFSPSIQDAGQSPKPEPVTMPPARLPTPEPVPPPPPVPTTEELMAEAEERSHRLAPDRSRILRAAQDFHQREALRLANIARLETEISRLEIQLERELKEEAEADARRLAAIEERRAREQARIDGFPHGLRTWYRMSQAQKQSPALIKWWLPIFYADGSIRYDSHAGLPAEERLVPNFQAAVLLADADLGLAQHPRFVGEGRRRTMTEVERGESFGRIFHIRLVDRGRVGDNAHYAEQADRLRGMADADLFWVRYVDLVEELREFGLARGSIAFEEDKVRKPIRYMLESRDAFLQRGRREEFERVIGGWELDPRGEVGDVVPRVEEFVRICMGFENEDESLRDRHEEWAEPVRTALKGGAFDPEWVNGLGL